MGRKSKTAKTRRKFDDQLKIDTVQRIRNGEVTMAQAGRELGILMSVIGGWCKHPAFKHIKAQPKPKSPAKAASNGNGGQIVGLPLTSGARQQQQDNNPTVLAAGVPLDVYECPHCHGLVQV